MSSRGMIFHNGTDADDEPPPTRMNYLDDEGSESPPFPGTPQFSVPKMVLGEAGARGSHEVTNEISAPYEVPQFPIEQIEKKLAIQRQISSRVAKDLEDKRSHYEPSLGPAPDDADHPFKLEEHDFVPHFQRVSISGEDTSGACSLLHPDDGLFWLRLLEVPLEDLQQASRLLVRALHIRERYMAVSHQSFPSITSRFLRSVDAGCPHIMDDVQHEDRRTIAVPAPLYTPDAATKLICSECNEKYEKNFQRSRASSSDLDIEIDAMLLLKAARKGTASGPEGSPAGPCSQARPDHPVHAPASKGDPWECEFPPASGYLIRPVAGVFQLYRDAAALERGEALNYPYPNLPTFVQDMNLLCAMIADGPLLILIFMLLLA